MAEVKRKVSMAEIQSFFEVKAIFQKNILEGVVAAEQILDGLDSGAIRLTHVDVTVLKAQREGLSRLETLMGDKSDEELYLDADVLARLRTVIQRIDNDLKTLAPFVDPTLAGGA